MGHARAILGLPTPELQTQLAEKAAAQGFSVRQVERLVKKINEPREPSEKPLQDPNIKAAVARARKRARNAGPNRRENGSAGAESRSNITRRKNLQRLYELILRQPGRSDGAGGRTRTCDLRIMRPPL